MAALTACSTTHPNTWRGVEASAKETTRPQVIESWGATSDARTQEDPVIAPGFLIGVRSLTDSKLNGEYRVDFDGNLQLPYDVTVNTNDVTLSQLKKKLSELYRPYFKNPSELELRVKERRYFLDVRGLVDKPGRYLVAGDASLDSVIGLAGGLNKERPPLYVRLEKGTKSLVFDLEHYYNQGDNHPRIVGWLGGEVVFFQKEISIVADGSTLSGAQGRLPVYLIGEVRKPGEYVLSPGADFVDSIVQAGGFTDRADLDNIEIVRQSGNQKLVYPFSWKKFESAPRPAQGDIVYVHADNQPIAERHTVLIVTIISALASVATAAVFILAYNRGRI